MEGRGIDRDAESESDRVNRRIGLLRRDSAVSEREARHVARRVDVVDSDNATMAVDGNEPVGVAGYPGKMPALEPGHRHDVVRRDRAAVAEEQFAGAVARDLSGGDELDAPVGQQLAELVTRSRAER